MEIEELKRMEREGRRAEAMRLLEQEVAVFPENAGVWRMP